MLLATCLVSRADIYLFTGPIISPQNGHAYYLLSSSKWTEAEAMAVSMGGHLATIRDAQEDAWVFSTFTNYADRMWIGLSDAQVEGTFVWSSGDTNTYCNWALGEPNNLGGVPGEDYVLYYPASHADSGKWNDTTDTDLANGVVEVVPEPSTLALLGIGASFITAVARRRASKRG